MGNGNSSRNRLPLAELSACKAKLEAILNSLKSLCNECIDPDRGKRPIQYRSVSMCVCVCVCMGRGGYSFGPGHARYVTDLGITMLI